MNLKSIIAGLLVAFAALPAAAQGINFMPEGSKLSEACAKAKAEKKLVFLDCYTSWCGPCKMMAKNVFTQQQVGDFMNPSYVSIKIDMEKGEGPALAKKFEISAYPTFLIINGDGQEVGRFLGGSSAEEFIQRVKSKSVDNGSAELDKRYENGDRDPEFLLQYLTTLGSAHKRDKSSEVAELLLAGKENTFASDSTLADIFMKYVNNPFCPAFVQTVKNPQALAATVGERNAQMKLFSVFEYYPRTLINEEEGKVTLDEDNLAKFVAMLNECGNDRAEHYRLSTLINYAQKKGDWNQYVGLIKEYANGPKTDADDLSLLKWSTPIAKGCQDMETRAAMRSILQQRLDDLNSGKREVQKKAGAMTLSGDTRKPLEMLIKNLGEAPGQQPG